MRFYASKENENMRKLAVLLLLVLTFASCSEYQKALKSEDLGFKNEIAEKQYNAGKYKKALRLYEEIAPSYRGKPNAERLFYYLSKTYYAREEYYTAAYQFESFVSNYPKSEKREEAAFLAAECYYRQSPKYSLDQIDTDKALTKLQSFIDRYPDSEYLPQANAYVKELREKLEKKAFEIAKQYYDIAEAYYGYEYDVAIKALDNFILDYPGTPYKEDAQYYKLKSVYKIAENSVLNKKEERLLTAKSVYNSYLKNNPEGKFKKEADNIYANIEKELQQLSNTN